MVSMDMIVVRSDAVLSAQVAEETVLMSVDNGSYYTLAATSRAIWARLDQPICVRDLCDALLRTYQAPAETVEADTLAFLTYLETQRMIETRAAPE
jgi:hypothetical protein